MPNQPHFRNFFFFPKERQTFNRTIRPQLPPKLTLATWKHHRFIFTQRLVVLLVRTVQIWEKAFLRPLSIHIYHDGHLLPNITTRKCPNSYCFSYEQCNYYFIN